MRNRVKTLAGLVTGVHGLRRGPGGLAATSVAVVLFSLFASSASAKEVVAYFGTESGSGTLGGQFKNVTDIAVNGSGTGVAGKGDIYALDISRIQRFAQNDNGTPDNPYDDKYEFISAWGTGVGTDSAVNVKYEVCTVASDCQAGVGSGGNGSASGNGAIGQFTAGIAVDQDTGDVYLADAANNRVNVYEGDGTFLRSFGWDVVESGPDDNGTGYEVCVAANDDVCKPGSSGPGVGQIGRASGIAVSPADGDSSSGEVYLTDNENHRVNTYDLDGANPSSFGSVADYKFGPERPTVDSRGILYTIEPTQAEGSIVARYDTKDANGGGVGLLAPIKVPPLAVSPKSTNRQMAGIKVDPDSDGPGPDQDVLYVLRDLGPAPDTVIQQFGPINAPGLTAPPAADDSEHGSVIGFNFVTALGVDESNGRLFVGDPYGVGNEEYTANTKVGIYVLDTAGGAPNASLDSLSDATATGVTIHGTVDPNGPPDVTYKIEYSTDGSNWTSTPEVLVGSQEGSQAIDTVLSPGVGLQPNTHFHVRLVATKAFTPPVVTAEQTFSTLPAGPIAETTGSPLRTSTTARLEGRVDPRNSPTDYHFEYGAQGPCDSNPCTSTEGQSVGSGNFTKLVSQEVSDLEAGITYHYRVVGDNGAPGSPVYGNDMSVTTRASDAPLSHGHFPGPPGSDRAYELISPSDTSGNPTSGEQGLPEDGNRAFYGIAGGTPASTTGNLFAFYFAERTPTGWQTKGVMPPRDRLTGTELSVAIGPKDFSTFGLVSFNNATGQRAVWRLSPTEPAFEMSSVTPPEETGYVGGVTVSQDPFRAFQILKGGNGFDPAHPAAAAHWNLYEITSGTPKLVSVLPDGTVPPCGIAAGQNLGEKATTPDGSHIFFRSGTPLQCPSESVGLSDPQQYVRDLDTGVTTALPGWESFIRADNGVAYFWTRQRLTSEDSVPSGGAGDGDIYSYGIGDGKLKCLTCVAPAGLHADVAQGNNLAAAVISGDGSRVYFRSTSPQPLVTGARPSPGLGTTYVVDTDSGVLKWAGPGVILEGAPQKVTNDGAAVIFDSADPNLNPVGGLDNGGTSQTYRYDDRDGSLVCVSCPQDGSRAPFNVSPGNSLAKDRGEDLAFATPTPLVDSDQNTSRPGQVAGRGTDVYEWRDGRLFLITDGLTRWTQENLNGTWPTVGGISATGRDLHFVVSAQYTPDALDSYARLYDARIGGGFEFPKPPPPCPLEVCQGTPQGAPEEPPPGTRDFAGPGNAPASARHKKKAQHKKTKRHHKERQHRANHKRRASR